MQKRLAQGLLLCTMGVIVLWVGWGNAISTTAGELCHTEPRGLHLDSSFQIVYRSPVCGAQVYDYALPVFLLLSAVGLGSVIGGSYRLKQSFDPSTQS